MKKAKVLSVYDEGALEDTSFIGATGFSVLVEVDGQRTLFDTGMRGRYLIHNLDYLDVKPDMIDRVVISHNHKGNMGGLGKLLDERTEPVDIYVNGQFSSLTRLFGRPLFSEEQSSKARIHVMEGDTEFSEHLAAMGPFGDLEEYSLVLKSTKGPVVISSCYHCGTDPVLTKVKERYGRDIHNLIGGLHIRKANQKSINSTADVIEGFGSPHMYICHCAEESAITYLRVRFNIKGVDNFYVGSSVEYEVF